MKGVSTVIATVLVLVITIALAGSAYLFFSGILTGKTSAAFNVNPIEKRTILISNYGDRPIDNLIILVNGQEINKSDATYLPDDLMSYYPFSEGTGLTTADLGLYKNHGTLGNGAAGTEPAWTDGKDGKALRFNGILTFAEFPNSESLNIKDNITISTWIFFEGLSGKSDVDMILNKEGIPYEIAVQEPSGVHPNCGNTTYAGYLIWYLGGVSTNAIHTSCGWKLGSLYPIPTNTWTHVALVYDGTNIRTYVNGQLQYEFSGSGSISETTRTLRIGNRGNLNSPFKGVIDEVKLYNSPLSVERLLAEKKGNFYLLPHQNSIVTINATSLSSPGTYTVTICSSSVCNTVPIFV